MSTDDAIELMANKHGAGAARYAVDLIEQDRKRTGGKLLDMVHNWHNGNLSFNATMTEFEIVARRLFRGEPAGE